MVTFRTSPVPKRFLYGGVGISPNLWIQPLKDGANGVNDILPYVCGFHAPSSPSLRNPSSKVGRKITCDSVDFNAVTTRTHSTVNFMYTLLPHNVADVRRST